MDLKPFVGKRVMVQFKPGVGYAAVTVIDGRPAPLVLEVKTPEGPVAQPVVVPYMDGKVEEGPTGIVLVYGDLAPGNKGNTLRLSISPEMIFAVTEPVEPGRILTLT